MFFIKRSILLVLCALFMLRFESSPWPKFCSVRALRSILLVHCSDPGRFQRFRSEVERSTFEAEYVTALLRVQESFTSFSHHSIITTTLTKCSNWLKLNELFQVPLFIHFSNIILSILMGRATNQDHGIKMFTQMTRRTLSLQDGRRTLAG